MEFTYNVTYNEISLISHFYRNARKRLIVSLQSPKSSKYLVDENVSDLQARRTNMEM